jgi:hypothetical protein
MLGGHTAPAALARAGLRFLMSAATAVVLASCGGGGGGGGDCPATTVYDSYGYGTRSLDGEIDEPISLTLAAHVQTGCRLSHRIEGSLPPGVQFDASSGAITGTPSAGGVYEVTVRPDVASSDVSTGLTLSIQPLGRASLALVPLELNAPSFSGQRLNPRIAAAAGAGVTHLWIGSWVVDGERFRVYRSSDGGASWSGDTTGGLIRAHGDTLGDFLLAASADKAYVLEAGADVQFVPVPNVLYRYDGSAWALRNDTLPFVAPRGASMQALPNGRVAVAWSDSTGISLWTSDDEGATWTKRSASGGISPGFLDNGLSVCLGATGGDWHVVATPGDFFAHARLGAGSETWSEPAWRWGSYAQPFALCASDGERMWLAGQPATTAQNYLMLADIVEGETDFAFPRRIKAMGPTFVQQYFESMTASAGSVYGLLVETRDSGAVYRLWALR